MKHTRIKSVLLPLALALPVFATQAAEEISEAELQRQFNEIKTRLAQLEQGKVASEEQESNTEMHFYGTLRPTFGVTSTDERDDWDVGDALSRIGFAAEHELSNGMVGFAKGEFKVQIQGDAHFGDARKAYVGIKGDFGRIAIGKQETTQYAFIGTPVDIFNRGVNSPLGYDDVSVFRQQEMVSYRKSFGNFEIRGEAQFKGEDKVNEGSDLVNAGVNYMGDDYSVGVAYLTRNLAGADQNTLGVSASKSIGDWYFAAAYLDIEHDVVGGDITTIDVVATYAINNQYKLLFGVSQLDDEQAEVNSKDVARFNTTLEWQGSKDFRLFIEYQHNEFDNDDVNLAVNDSDQLTVGMRYNFDVKF